MNNSYTDYLKFFAYIGPTKFIKNIPFYLRQVYSTGEDFLNSLLALVLGTLCVFIFPVISPALAYYSWKKNKEMEKRNKQRIDDLNN